MGEFDLNLIRRLVKGAPITAEEHDHNLDALEDGIEAVAGSALELEELIGDVEVIDGRVTTVEGKVDTIEGDMPGLLAHADAVDGNPHGVTKADVGLTNVLNEQQVVIKPLSTNPADPDPGKHVIWVSNGEEGQMGQAGDLLIKINAGGVVKTFVLIEFAGGEDYEE